MKYAFINDDEIKKIEDTEEELALNQRHLYQQVVSIEAMSPEPQVGWEWVNGVVRKKYSEITPRQLLQALVILGIDLSMIDAALDSLPEPTRSLAKISWERAIGFNRYDPLVSSVGMLLGWGDAEIDALWDLGGSI